MAYEEYDYYNEPATGSLKESLYEILRGFKSEKNLRETGEAISRVRNVIPNVAESLARGGIGQAIGTSGDLREIRNMINSYLPKSVRNFTQAAEFLANPYQTSLNQTTPTTEKVLETIPRATDTYEGYKQHETLGEYVAPALGYFGAKAVKAGMDLPVGLSIMGPESKLWNKEMAFNAGKLEAKGATPDEILEKTGMVRGLDNQWRSELSDQFAKMKKGENFGEIYRRGGLDGVWSKENVMVKDVLEHPTLFEAYPQFANIKVKTHSSDIPARGSYNQKRNEISLREDLTPDEAKSVMLHELTHGVQAEESLNRGANAAELVRAYEKRQQDLLPRISELSDQMREANMAGDMEKYRQIMAERDALSKEYTSINPEEMGYEDYFRHGGEAEARMVQRRMDLSPEELRQRFPYQFTGEQGYGLDINPDEAIITTKQPGTINMPEQSIEPPKSKVDELGFHSPLENAILKIQQPKGTGDQFLKQLEKTPGVKTEELDVTGVKQYLLDHPTVTKQELLDYMASSRLKLENKILDESMGGADTYDEYSLRGGDVYHDDDYIQGLADDLHYDMKNDDVIRSQEREALLEADPERYLDFGTGHAKATLENDIDNVLYENAKAQANEMYYDNPIRHYYDDHGYDIYGNDDMGYSVKDPRGQFVDIGTRNYSIDDVQDTLRQHLLDEGVIDIGSEGGPKYEDYTLPGKYTNYREMLTTLPSQSAYDKASMDMFEFRKAVNKRLDKPTGGWDYEELTPQEQMKYDILNERMLRANKNKNEYQSGHFDEPNILAHTRLNDRIINGKKTLMVEEIQSDWHQAGRRKGYTQPISEEKKMEIRLELDKLQEARKELYKVRANQVINKEPTIDSIDAPLANLERQEVELRNQLKGNIGVPDAPFKKNWHELMMKQILNEAVKGDYDAVAFTTGKQQADRYSLSKQISSIKYTDDGQLRAYGKNGEQVISRKLNSPDELEDYIGKEAAKKLMEQEPKMVSMKGDIGTVNDTGRELSGVDLDVGGEGMKGFYDKILPDFVNKYGKKYGIAVKKEHLTPPDNDRFMNFKDWAVQKDPSLNDTFLKHSWANKDDLYKEFINTDRRGDEVHFFDLSDMAKKDIKSKGQPLFSGIGLAAPPLLMDNEEDN